MNHIAPRTADGAETSGARPLDVAWIHGSPSAKHDTGPEIQVYAHTEDTVILRQNMAVDYEAPFLFLLFGADRAVLVDTGATTDPAYFPLRRVVDELVEQWLAAHPRAGYEVLVLHSHAHGDHVAADGQFADRPDTRVVGATWEDAWPFFGFDTEPGRIARVELGGRTLECLATPGHDSAAVTYYDERTGFLLTGDTVYPGRLYVRDWSAFAATIARLADFAASRRVTHVLGCHIEMTREPGVDYPIRTVYQPDEPPLELSVARLRAIRDAVAEIGGRPGDHRYDDFVICNLDG